MRSYNEVLFCLSIVLEAFFIEDQVENSIGSDPCPNCLQGYKQKTLPNECAINVSTYDWWRALFKLSHSIPKPVSGVCGGSIETTGSSSSYFIGLRITLYVTVGVISLISFLCTAMYFLEYLRDRNRTPGIPEVVIRRTGELPSNSQPSNSRGIRLMALQPENRVSNTAPPADSEMDQPIFNV